MKQKVSIIGLGYVGAPLAYLAAAKGLKVVGIDTSEQKVLDINKYNNVPEQLSKYINSVKDNLIAFNDYSNIKDSDIIIICVPTPTINNVPDLNMLNNAIDGISTYLKDKCLVIIESTIAPGMTKKHVEERLSRYNIILGKDYDLAYCPERVDPGNRTYWVGNINRVCGASSEESLNKAINFYKKVLDSKIISMNSIEEAELVKVWENSTRNMAIAQANLLAKICDNKNMDVETVISGLKSKTEQFPLNIAHPGIGPGGHCIPEDIHYLIDVVKDIDMGLFKESVKINESMPQYAVDKLIEELKKEGTILKDLNIVMLGISYKPNTNDTRRSQAKVLFDIAKELGANITYFDPIVDNIEDYKAKKILNNILKQNDVIILGCAHSMFLDIDFSKYSNIKYVLDCWNKYYGSNLTHTHIKHIGIGKKTGD